MPFSIHYFQGFKQIWLVLKVGASITSFSEIVTGSYDGGLKTKIFFFVGLALSFLLVIFLSWISKRAIEKAISEAKLQQENQQEKHQNQKRQNKEQTQSQMREERFFQNIPFLPTPSTPYCSYSPLAPQLLYTPPSMSSTT